MSGLMGKGLTSHEKMAVSPLGTRIAFAGYQPTNQLHLPVNQIMYLSSYFFIYFSISISINASAYSFIYLSIYQSIYLSIYPIYLSIYLCMCSCLSSSLIACYRRDLSIYAYLYQLIHPYICPLHPLSHLTVKISYY